VEDRNAGRSAGRRVGLVWLVTLALSACAIMTAVSPAMALEPSKVSICESGTLAAEGATRSLHLEPTNGARVPAGTPVVFSVESLLDHTPTFSVASSPALLSSPDIDSGTGVQSGAFYKFTSTKASAVPRILYWTVSFTFTVEDCEGPSIFTTPVQTLTVAPTEAELVAGKQRQEEEAANKKSQEEATAKKKSEETAASGSIVLDDVTITVEHNGKAAVKLTCSDVLTCTGKLTITAPTTARKGKARHEKTESLGTASFSIAAGKEATINMPLTKGGLARLSAAHGHLNATLTISRTSPSPHKTQSEHIHLRLQTVKTT
jgi:hypothetical protein